MSILSPAKAEAFWMLRNDLYAHLDEAEFLTMSCGAWTEAEIASARRLIPDLVVAIRTVLFEHQATESENCRFCFRQWPCPTVQAIHRVVKDPHREFVKLLDKAE